MYLLTRMKYFYHAWQPKPYKFDLEGYTKVKKVFVGQYPSDDDSDLLTESFDSEYVAEGNHSYFDEPKRKSVRKAEK